MRASIGIVAATVIAAISTGCVGRRPNPRTVAPGEVLALPESYAQSIAALGYPGAKRAFQIGHGSVADGGGAALEWRVTSPPGPLKVSPVFFERDGVPIAHWTISGEGIEVRFEAAALPVAALGDSSLALSIRATATWSARAPGTFELETVVRGAPEGPHSAPWDASNAEHFDEAWEGRSAIRYGHLVALVDERTELPADPPTAQRPARAQGFGAGALRAACRARLAPGESQHWDFILPAYATAASGRELRGAVVHDRIVERARGVWRGWLDEGARLSVPDALVLAAYRAALVTLLQCQERVGPDWAPIGSPFQYRDVWLRDGARAVRALAVAGLTARARANAWTLLPNGALISQRGQLDGTGQALWAFAQSASPRPTRPRRAGSCRSPSGACDGSNINVPSRAKPGSRGRGCFPTETRATTSWCALSWWETMPGASRAAARWLPSRGWPALRRSPSRPRRPAGTTTRRSRRRSPEPATPTSRPRGRELGATGET